MNLVKRLVRWTLGKRLPRHEGQVHVRGARGTIDIRRDRWGIPYIDAADAHDAWFGLGFCHAQDRMGQMELTLRIARGTLAEVAGKDALPIDRLVRRLGIPQAGAAQLAVADADIRAQFAAYAAGVNACLQTTRRAAHEHALLRIRPTPWTPEDAQRLTALLCFALAANWDIELARYEIARHHGVEALHALDPLVPEGLVLSIPPGATTTSDAGGTHDGVVERFLADARELEAALGLGGGSNAWAVAAGKSATGRPQLAGDPHLPPQSPNQFYFARLRCPEFTAVGATFVGIPAFGAGHNTKVAWGITAAHLDTTDLFVERIGGPDGKSVEEDGAHVACEVRREVIAVKGAAAPHIEEVLVTRRGPLLGPVLEGAPDNLSIAATWLAPRPYRGLFGVHLAKDVAEVRACFAQATTTNLGLVFAEAPSAAAPGGHIGWLLAAEVPVRRGNSGPLPQPGWDARFGWDGLVPPDAMPLAVDPVEGFVASANNTPVARARAAEHASASQDDVSRHFGVDFLDGYRATAISRALAARGDWTLAAHQALQADVRSLVWEEVRAVVLAAAPAPARALLAAWDGHMRADSEAASVFALFVSDMVARVVRAKAPHAFATAMGKGSTLLLPHNLLFARRTSHLSRLLRERPAGWFSPADGGAEPARAAWDAEVRAALEAVTARLAGERDKAWGAVRPLRMLHPFGDKRPLDKVFNLGPMPFGGDATTIPQAAIDFVHPTANPIGVPVFRMVIDVGAWDESRFALLGGQSGNPFSPNVDDQVAAWHGAGVPIPVDDARLAAVARLVLRPA